MFEGIKFTYFTAVFFSLLVIPYVFLRLKLRKMKVIKYSPMQYFQVKASSSMLYYLPLLFEAVIILLLILVAMGPYVETRREIVSDKGVDIALALDVSASMQAADFKPNRLEAMKEISVDFIKKSGSNRIALYVFAKHTFTQTPLAMDHAVLIDLIDGIAYEMIDHQKSGGTAIGDVLLMATEGLVNSRIKGRDQAIILITDGESNNGIDPLTGARYTLENNIRLYIIGVGGDDPIEVYINGKPFINVKNEILKTHLDDTQLKKIAGASNGKYYRARNNEVLADIFEEISRLESTPLEVESHGVKKYYGSKVGIAMLLVFLFYMFTEGIIIRRPYR